MLSPWKPQDTLPATAAAAAAAAAAATSTTTDSSSSSPPNKKTLSTLDASRPHPILPDDSSHSHPYHTSPLRSKPIYHSPVNQMSPKIAIFIPSPSNNSTNTNNNNNNNKIDVSHLNEIPSLPYRPDSSSFEQSPDHDGEEFGQSIWNEETDPDDEDDDDDDDDDDNNNIPLVETVSSELVEASPIPATRTEETTTTSTTQVVVHNPNATTLLWDDAIPDLLKLQEHSVRRRQDALEHIHGLECQLAQLTAQLAHASMSRLTETQALQQHIFQQQRTLLEQLFLDEQSFQNNHHWMYLEGRLTEVNETFARDMARLHDQKQQLKAIQGTLDSLAKQIKDMSRATHKRQGTVARKLESLAGSMARRYHEERACRVAAWTNMTHELSGDIDPRYVDQAVQEIRQMRAQVAAERELRLQQESSLRETIAKATEALNRSLLDVVGEADLSLVDTE